MAYATVIKPKQKKVSVIPEQVDQPAPEMIPSAYSSLTTEEMANEYADRPIITMSMAGTGVISRLAGEVFGSALTFGAAAKASAPGQMGVEDLKQVLTLLHGAL